MKIFGVKKETDIRRFFIYHLFENRDKNKQEITIDRVTTAYVTFLGLKVHWTKRIRKRSVYYLPLKVKNNFIPVEY